MPTTHSSRGPWAAKQTRGGPPVLLGNDEIALAMELRSEGLRIKCIARGLGVSPDYLGRTLSRALATTECVPIQWALTNGETHHGNSTPRYLHPVL